MDEWVGRRNPSHSGDLGDLGRQTIKPPNSASLRGHECVCSDPLTIHGTPSIIVVDRMADIALEPSQNDQNRLVGEAEAKGVQ